MKQMYSERAKNLRTNLNIVSSDGVSENQVIRSNVAKTQQPDAERLKNS